MKADELMIGDWIYIMCRNKAAKVTSIDAGRIGNIGTDILRPLLDDEWKPIPLTPEILEKNGFKYTNNHTLKGCDTYVCDHGSYTLTYKLGDYFAVDSFDDRYYRLFETQFCHRWYVHQLQHALRLCGIEKEIEL